MAELIRSLNWSGTSPRAALLDIGGFFLLLQGGRFGGGFERHLFKLFAFWIFLDQFLEFAVKQTL